MPDRVITSFWEQHRNEIELQEKFRCSKVVLRLGINIIIATKERFTIGKKNSAKVAGMSKRSVASPKISLLAQKSDLTKPIFEIKFTPQKKAGVAELADALRSGRSEGSLMWVQVPPSAHEVPLGGNTRLAERRVFCRW